MIGYYLDQLVVIRNAAAVVDVLLVFKGPGLSGSGLETLHWWHSQRVLGDKCERAVHVAAIKQQQGCDCHLGQCSMSRLEFKMSPTEGHVSPVVRYRHDGGFADRQQLSTSKCTASRAHEASS